MFLEFKPKIKLFVFHQTKPKTKKKEQKIRGCSLIQVRSFAEWLIRTQKFVIIIRNCATWTECQNKTWSNLRLFFVDFNIEYQVYTSSFQLHAYLSSSIAPPLIHPVRWVQLPLHMHTRLRHEWNGLKCLWTFLLVLSHTNATTTNHIMRTFRKVYDQNISTWLCARLEITWACFHFLSCNASGAFMDFLCLCVFFSVFVCQWKCILHTGIITRRW